MPLARHGRSASHDYGTNGPPVDIWQPRDSAAQQGPLRLPGLTTEQAFHNLRHRHGWASAFPAVSSVPSSGKHGGVYSLSPPANGCWLSGSCLAPSNAGWGTYVCLLRMATPAAVQTMLPPDARPTSAWYSPRLSQRPRRPDQGRQEVSDANQGPATGGALHVLVSLARMRKRNLTQLSPSSSASVLASQCEARRVAWWIRRL